MKRIITAVLAAASLSAPLALPAAAAAHERDRQHRDYDRDYDQHYRDDRDSDWRTDRYRRDLRRAIRREDWNSRAFNGYTYRGQWQYGAPPAAYYLGSTGRRNITLLPALSLRRKPPPAFASQASF